jgi:hypothetical protein
MTGALHTRSLHERLRLRAFLTAIAVLWCLLAPASAWAGELDFPSTDYTIRSIDGLHVIGHVHFAVTAKDDGLTTVRGEYRFLDGNYDIDQSTLRPGVGANLPTLVRTDHSFFFPDGSPDRESHIEFAAGTAACTIYTDGKPTVSSAKFDFPSDTFAGDTVMLPLRRYVAAGGNGSLSFHAFNCIPGPKLLKVTATARAPAPWDYYPGNLVQVDVTPDFGWINIVIAPFLPQIRAWFDPRDDAFFVGGETARYYKGLKYMMVRVRPTNAEIKAGHTSAPDSTEAPVPQAQPTPRSQPTG